MAVFHELCLVVILSIIFSSSADPRSNSKRLRWDSRSNSKRLRWDEESGPIQSRGAGKGDLGLSFINNMPYALSKKHQELMWDLYLRKGYAPSLSPQSDQKDKSNSYANSGYTRGTATFVDPNSDLTLYGQLNHVNAEKSLRRQKRPNGIASRILDQYERMTKAPRIVPDYEENELLGNEIVFSKDDLPRIQSTTEAASASSPARAPHSEDDGNVQLKSESGLTSLFYSFWEMVQDYIDKVMSREMQDTILDTLWSWWTSLVEFAKSRGKKRALGESHSLL